MRAIPQYRITAAIVLFAFAAGILAFGFPTASQTTPVFSLTVAPELAFAGDRVTVSVVPENFSATSTVYTWFRDETELIGASGLGRSSLSFLTDATKTEIVQIRAAVNPGPGFVPGEQKTAIITIPSPAQQQEALDELKSEFALEASELNPNPGETVTIRVKTFAFDKAAASYRWFVNGAFQRERSGRGRSEITVLAGAEGKTQTVRVEVTTLDGLTKTNSLTILTASASLYWWADTTVPYWYRAKALPSANSRVTVVAIPPPGMRASDLSYQWQFNGAIIPSSSGFGKNTFTFSFDFPVRESIEVTMKTLDGSFVKTAAISIEPRSPTVTIYEVRPLRGVVSERQLTEFTAPSGDSYDFIAVPFFFAREREKTLSYLWTLNGGQITGKFAKPWLFTLKPRAGEATSNQLQVEVADSRPNGDRVPAFIRADFR